VVKASCGSEPRRATGLGKDQVERAGAHPFTVESPGAQLSSIRSRMPIPTRDQGFRRSSADRAQFLDAPGGMRRLTLYMRRRP
jgi:hypothetical protein